MSAALRVVPGLDGLPWDDHPMLRHIAQAARARRVAPTAVLGCVLARVVAAMPPTLVLPPLVGGQASLNLFIALVGGTGRGKGAADAVARELLEGTPAGLDATEVGTGEGMVKAFVGRRKDEGHELRVHTDRRLFIATEIDALAAKGVGRAGTTLLAYLRQVWSGEAFGATTGDVERNLAVPAHAYRACLVLGVQPERAGWLLDDATGGTPGRFCWFGTVDVDAPDDRPAWPGPLPWHAPGVLTERRQQLVLPTAATTYVDDQRKAALRGGEVDAVDGHQPLLLVKVAAALALLEGRATDVPDACWELARLVVAESDVVREHVLGTLRAEQRAEAEQRGRADGRRQLAAGEFVAEQVAGRATERVILLLRRAAGRRTLQQLAAQMSGPQREQLPDVLDALAAAGLVQLVPGVGREDTVNVVLVRRDGRS